MPKWASVGSLGCCIQNAIRSGVFLRFCVPCSMCYNNSLYFEVIRVASLTSKNYVDEMFLQPSLIGFSDKLHQIGDFCHFSI